MRSICVFIVFFWMGATVCLPANAMETPFVSRILSAPFRSRLFFLSARREPRPPGKYQAKVFEAIWKTVRDDFYDSKMRGLNWDNVRKKYRPIAIGANDADAFEVVINRMLAELKTSHTHYFNKDNPKYYLLLGIFASSPVLKEKLKGILTTLPNRKLGYVGLGIETMKFLGKGLFVSAVYNGSPAEQAGLLVGDRLISANDKPFHPLRSFLGKENRKVDVIVQRTADGKPFAVTVTPIFLDATKMYEQFARNSIRLIEKNEKKIAYVHLWSYAGEVHQKILEDAILRGKLKDADALVLDLRDGWGGASPDYINLFNSAVPSLKMQTRNGEIQLNHTWTKPVALLINSRVRSGKEIIAYSFRKLKRGPVVGTNTAGAVVGGSPRIMPDLSLLYLAVADVTVDGKRLEGIGVAPTICVARRIPYSRGKDPQFAAAVDTLISNLKQSLPCRKK